MPPPDTDSSFLYHGQVMFMNISYVDVNCKIQLKYDNVSFMSHNTCSLRLRPARLDSQSLRVEFLALDNVVFRSYYVNAVVGLYFRYVFIS